MFFQIDQKGKPYRPYRVGVDGRKFVKSFFDADSSWFRLGGGVNRHGGLK